MRTETELLKETNPSLKESDEQCRIETIVGQRDEWTKGKTTLEQQPDLSQRREPPVRNNDSENISYLVKNIAH